MLKSTPYSTAVLGSFVDCTKMVFKAACVDAPFIIAGGSVYSTLKGLDKFDDIDIFFYNKDDATRVITALIELEKVMSKVKSNDLAVVLGQMFLTNNALTFYASFISKIISTHIPYDMQFIQRKFGSPQELFDSFDLNCSKFAITSNKEIVAGCNLDDELTINIKQFKSNTYTRFNKYINEKYCITDVQQQTNLICEHLVHNFYNIIDGGYNGSEIIGHNLLSKMLINDTSFKYIHDLLCTKFKKYDLITAFEKLNISFDVKFMDVCDECIVASYNNTKDDDLLPFLVLNYSQKQIQSARTTFPEYFI